MSAQSGHSSRHLHRYNPAAPSHRPSTLSELEVLQRNHRFIRDEDDGIAAHTWEEQLSLSWYNKLFREYALCDLTQYKSGGVALRWRIEQEVLDRLGELTCGALECKHHQPVYTPRNDDNGDESPLVAKDLAPYQLNFRYEEGGQIKQALVKVVLCDRCSRKLTWKRDREKDKLRAREEDWSTNGHAKGVAADAKRAAETAMDDEKKASAGGSRDRELRPVRKSRDVHRRSRSPESSKSRNGERENNRDRG